ncbi:MAG: exodeoxyribonuclease VII small subunit [Saprospiraceae bacterium]|nr:exodeoxyribonuclease VII small subunit [Saprospiraceae bacterium]
MKKVPKSYEAAMQELEQLVADLQSDMVSIDHLAEQSKRAAELIKWCREKLRNTEQEVEKIFE